MRDNKLKFVTIGGDTGGGISATSGTEKSMEELLAEGMRERGYSYENGAFKKSMEAQLAEGMRKRGYSDENGTFIRQSGDFSIADKPASVKATWGSPALRAVERLKVGMENREKTMQSGGAIGARDNGIPESSPEGITQQLQQISEKRKELDKIDKGLNVDRGYLANLGEDWETAYANSPEVMETARGAQRRLDEVQTNRARLDEKEKALLEEFKNLTGMDYDEYQQKYGDNRGPIQTFLDRLLDVGDAAVVKGASEVATGTANTLDLFVGKPLQAAGWKNNPLSWGAGIMNDFNDQRQQDLMDAAGDSKAWQVAGQVLSSAVAAAPAAIAAYFTGGASLASPEGLARTAAAQGMSGSQLLGQSVGQMMKNPNYWTSFLQEVGNDFREAQKWAKNDAVAGAYAMTVGLINSGIEIGLDGTSGVQGLEQAVREGRTGGLMEWLNSLGEEGFEEVRQGLVSRGVAKAMGSGAPLFSTTDPDAVFNPRTSLEEGAMGAAAAGLLTGGQLIGQRVLSGPRQVALQDTQTPAEEPVIVRDVLDNVMGPVRAQETAQGAQNADVRTVAPQGENAVTGRMEGQTAGNVERQTNSAPEALPRLSMEDFANRDSPVWNNVDYNDMDARNGIQQNVHNEMVMAGQVVQIPESTRRQVSEAYPDLRGMKKSERTPLLKQKISELKANLRQFLNGLKGGSYEFEVNGNILEAKLYETGVREVMEKINQDKASMLYETENIFRNSRYLYSTPDYEDNPNIYRWNYFYTPVQIGDEIVGVRIAVRDINQGENHTPESQIYNWGIKRGPTLDGGQPGVTNASSLGVSSVEPSSDTSLDGARRGISRSSGGVSSDGSNTNVPQSSPVVNPVEPEQTSIDLALDDILGVREQKGTPAADPRSIPAALNGSTGLDGAVDQGPTDSLTPGERYVNSIVEEMLGKSSNRRVDLSEVAQHLVARGDTNPEDAQGIAEGYNALFSSGNYDVDAAGKLYKTGGETDLSLDQRRGDLYELGKRNINAFQFDHPQVHQYYAEAANWLLQDLKGTTKGQRIFDFDPETGGAPKVRGIKRSTTAPIEIMLDEYHMTYERVEDVLNRIINDQGQENIADAKRVEVILDDMLRNGYTDIDGYHVGPNEAYLEAVGEISKDTRTPPSDESGIDTESQTDGLGAANRGFAESDYNQWVENAESIHPEGEDAVRNPSLPTRNLDGAKTSKVGQTVMEAANTPEERVIDIQNAYLNGRLTIDSRVDSSLVQQAVTRFNEDPEKVILDWSKDVKDGKVSNELVAMGAVLLDSEKVQASPALFMDILTDYVQLGSTAGQALQAQRIYKALSPEGRLYMIKRAAQGLSNDLGTQIEIPEEDAGAMLRAKTDEDVDAAMERIYQHLADQIPSRFSDKWTALRYMNMLGNFKTQIRNLAGNSLMTGMRAVKNEVAAGIEALAAKLNPNLERTQSAFVGKAWMDATKADFENVREAAQGNGRYDDTSRTAIEREIQARRRIFKTRPLEAYRKVTNWATNAGDEVFIKHHYARALAGYLKANGVQVEQFLEGNVDQQLLDRATDFAIKEAQEATFHDNNAFSDWVSKVGRRPDTLRAIKVIAEGVAPFRKTPANILARAYEYSPAGLIDTVVQAVKAGKGTATASDIINSAARVLTGTGIMALGFLLRGAGWLRGTGDPDDEEIDALMNRQDYSLTIPGVGSYTIDWLTPATLPLFMGANAWDIYDEHDWSLENLDSLFTQFTEPILETSMLSGINNAISSVKYSNYHSLQMAATFALSYVTQGLTNSLFGQIERAAEPNRMTTYVDPDNPMMDWMERSLGQASAKIPGLDFQQTEYRDEFGRTESNGNLVERIVENILSPGYWTSSHEGEKLYDDLQWIHDQTGANPWPDTSAPKSVTSSGEKYDLSQEDKERYQQTQGDIFTELAGEILDVGKKKFTPEEIADILGDIKSYAGSQAKREYYEENDIEAETPVNYIAKALAAVEEAKIPLLTYMEYYAKSGNLEYEKGVSGAKKAAVVALIDSLDLTDEQKDWMYINAGYAEKALSETPWNN